MTRPLLPPRGACIPTRMIYHSPSPPLSLSPGSRCAAWLGVGRSRLPSACRSLPYSPVSVWRSFFGTCPSSDLCPPYHGAPLGRERSSCHSPRSHHILNMHKNCLPPFQILRIQIRGIWNPRILSRS